MKKASVLAITTAIGIAGSTVLPVQAADTSAMYGKAKINGHAVTSVQIGSLDELKDTLAGLGGNLNQVYWQICPPGSNMPDVDIPGTDTPDTDGPEGNVPEPDMPDIDVPGTGGPDTDQPETDGPGTDVPGNDSNTPGGDTNQPGEDEDQPGGDINRPGGDTNQPGEDTDNPGENTEARTYAEQVVDLVNGERAKAGLAAVTLDKEIEAAALVRAKEIETSFSHTRPNGSSFSTALTERGITYRGSGENIAWGQRSPQDVMNSWMNSDGHRANILNPKFTKMGVGYYQNASGRNHWTQLFTY